MSVWSRRPLRRLRGRGGARDCMEGSRMRPREAKEEDRARSSLPAAVLEVRLPGGARVQAAWPGAMGASGFSQRKALERTSM